MNNNVKEITQGLDYELSCTLLEGKYTESELKDKVYYGLLLEKIVKGVVCDSASIDDIYTDKESVLALKEMLLDNQVTPVTFYDVVVDWVNQKYSL